MTSTQASVTDVDELLQRVRRLEAERDIQKLMVRYAESLDYGANDEWAACFAADGKFDVRMRNEPMFAHSGTTALSEFAAQHTHAPNVYHKHFLSIPTVHFVDDARATARTYFTMLHERPTGPIVLVIGRYLDDIVLLESGWVFQERIVDMEALPPPQS
jgi:3-phenylpropionate/cinnamic acid dioxygenase small subunit